jgi:protocatechuate 3,4-dioxygenase alpha subunit
MVQALHRLRESPSQTAGPYVHIGCTPNHCGIEGVYPTDLGGAMLGPHVRGERIIVKGHIYDGAGGPLKDAMVEIWQADAAGLYNSPAEKRGKADPDFTGFGRTATDGSHGEYRFETIKPGRVPFPDGRLMARHITFWIAARGINIGLHTRMYFSDEPETNMQCPVLSRIEHRNRVSTLFAVPDNEGGAVAYRFDIHLQGDRETIFFDI